jgi:hypothetical protein
MHFTNMFFVVLSTSFKLVLFIADMNLLLHSGHTTATCNIIVHVVSNDLYAFHRSYIQLDYLQL